jgi:hypothetical protein
MTLYDHQISVEAVQLSNGRYGVQAIGADGPDDSAGEFDTEAEAVEWIFNRAQRLSALRDDSPILTPGSGQGLR